VHENMQMPFRNDGNKVITQKYPLDNPNYLGDAADDDKAHPKKKLKKKKRKVIEGVHVMPFTNNARNQPITGLYNDTRLQYEDSDKPSPDISNEELECEVCGNSTHPGQFENGVCKHCAEHGYWTDKFGAIHNQNSRVRNQTKYT